MPFVPAVPPPAVTSPHPHWFVVRQNGLVVRAGGPCVALPCLEEVQQLGLSVAEAYYLGRLDGEDCFALDAGRVELAEPWAVQGLRGLYGQLDEALFSVAGRAVQIVTFGTTHRFCGACGQPTVRDPRERAMRCSTCEQVFYPRVSPAVIVLVRRGEEALLARSARFASGMYSTLAGFVEPGESLEQTLAREVLEEVGVQITNVRYFGSQPWPFPHSLMVGFFAEHAGGDIAVDGDEIVDARWFSAHDLPAIPPPLSIARKLIDTWVRDIRGTR